ncbi:oxidoreductase [Streptomyces coffeae]|uniref:SDR family NAD(P)-dependent oxidoreductase n=1 Tax=Streptomyces coffeae TaxID=621382 RepID=A0ABS1NQ74_9ACTN|nr:oxidoreductase [Streptomyces coffeae]MBL1102252.1 SDR family NAD(P)-dependent oxidoreductase [Streptomyces coffeae]
MTTPQQRIGSGFGPRSTTDDVLHGIDLSGRTALVTGGASGLGLETTRALTGAGARIVVGARRVAAAREAVARVGGDVSSVEEVDLADLDSVRRFTERFLASGRPLDMVICNAGIMACPETRVGPGWEAQFATNHLGHFALVNRLWPAIAAGGARGGGARVVVVSSNGHQLSDIRWDDPQFGRGYDKWAAYGQSKTANALFAVGLDVLGRDTGVRAFSVHPGTIATDLVRHVPQEEMIAAGWMDEHGNVTGAFKTPEQGAATQVWTATSPALADLGGAYCEDCDIAERAGEGELIEGVRDYATDRAAAARLWRLSAELTGVDAFATL